MLCSSTGCPVIARSSMAVLLASLFRLLYKPPDLFWLKRHLQMRDAKWRQGIDDSVCDRWPSANGPRFTAAFGTERIDGSRSDGTVDFQGGHHGGLGHGVIHQAPREQLAMLIVDDLFVEGLRQPLRHTPVHLAINDEWINDIAAVVHSHKTLNVIGASVRIDFDHANMRAKGEGGIAGLEATRCLQARLEIRRHTAHGHPVKVCGRKGYFGERLLAIGIGGDINFAIGVRHIVWPHIEHMRRDLLGFVLDLRHRHHHGGATDGQTPTAKRPNTIAHDIGIPMDDLDMLHGHPEFVRHDLRKRRLIALAMRRYAGEDAHRARWLDPDRTGLPASNPGRHQEGWTNAADLDIGRDADAQIAALLTQPLLLGAQLLI